jgi:hypothetical protein
MMGTLTINTTAGQDTRIQAAFGARLGTVDGNGDPRDATGAEVKDELINLIKTIVLQYEKNEAASAAAGAVTDIGDVT